MTRILFVSLFTATLTMTALGQTQNQPENTPVCSLSLSQAPVIRGIRLGMKPDEWLKLFPGSAQDEKIKAILDQPPLYPDYGFNLVTFGFPSSSSSQFPYLPREEFRGVNYVTLRLLDNQIAIFDVLYMPLPGGGNPWDDISQLATIFSRAFNLPDISAWKKEGSQRATLQCSGFELRLDIDSGQPRAQLISKPKVEQVIEQRREADKQKGRAAFKP
jgi:hypothetical protein